MSRMVAVSGDHHDVKRIHGKHDFCSNDLHQYHRFKDWGVADTDRACRKPRCDTTIVGPSCDWRLGSLRMWFGWHAPPSSASDPFRVTLFRTSVLRQWPEHRRWRTGAVPLPRCARTVWRRRVASARPSARRSQTADCEMATRERRSGCPVSAAPSSSPPDARRY